MDTQTRIGHTYRTENDGIGEKAIPSDALYGIHSLRAVENFPYFMPFHIEWYKAMGLVKLSVYKTYQNFKSSVIAKYKDASPIRLIDDDILKVLVEAATEISEGQYFEHFIVSGLQGGAGTSINMNINEILTNAALVKAGHHKGDYSFIDPFEHANIYQSTNDVVPTALKISIIRLLTMLQESINLTRSELEKLESDYRYDLRLGYTQLQEAVPTTFGRYFSTFSEAFSRDWWRVSKCFERIKVVNLGGSAIGTSIGVPRFFVVEMVRVLREITGLPLSQSENLSDSTSNWDSSVEIHGILKAHAVNLEKLARDFRLLSSGISAFRELSLPDKQVGSSIMPGKINPVIPEYVISACHQVYANDQLITGLCASGDLELNAYVPMIGQKLLESIKVLISSNQTLVQNMLTNLEVHVDLAKENLYFSPSITTAITIYIGYHNASKLAGIMKEKKCTIFEANRLLNLLPDDRLKELLKPDFLIKSGFSLNDLMGESSQDKE